MSEITTIYLYNFTPKYYILHKVNVKDLKRLFEALVYALPSECNDTILITAQCRLWFNRLRNTLMFLKCIDIKTAEVDKPRKRILKILGLQASSVPFEASLMDFIGREESLQ